MVMKVEREMLVNGNIFGYINIYVFDKIYVIVQIFELKTFQITVNYDKNKVNESIQCIFDKLWIVYAHYKANFTDITYYETEDEDDLLNYELKCEGYINDKFMFDYDDFEILKSNYVQGGFIRREYYLNHPDLLDHTTKESIDIHVSSKMLKVIYNTTIINNIVILENDKIENTDKIIECIFNKLQDSTGYIVKTIINGYYTYNFKNLAFLLSYDLQLPRFSDKSAEAGVIIKNGIVIKNYIDYLFINKL